MVWIQPRMIEHGVARKERESGIWTAECVNERFRLESLTVKRPAAASTTTSTSTSTSTDTATTSTARKKKTRRTSKRFATDGLFWQQRPQSPSPPTSASEDDDVDKLEDVPLDLEDGAGNGAGGGGGEGNEDVGCNTEGNTKLWRIVMLRTDVNSEAVVVAEDDAEEVIRADWQWIEANMLDKLSQIISEEGTDKVDKFLLLQFQMLYINQANEIALRQIELRRSVTSPPVKKKEAETEEVLSTLGCSLWVKLRYRAGTMRVYHSKIDFQGNTIKVLIFLTDILAVTKEKSTLMSKQDSLRIKAREGDYFFSDINKRDDVYELISQLWNMDMEKRLHKVKLGRTTNTALPPGNAAGTASLTSSSSDIDVDADDPMHTSTIGLDMSDSIGNNGNGNGNGNATDGDSTTRRDEQAIVVNNAPADVGPLLPTEPVSEFLTQSGSLVVGDFVISKSRDQVASKPQGVRTAAPAAADRFGSDADEEGSGGDDVMSRSDGGGEVVSRTKTSDELAALSNATRERSSSGTTAHGWAEPSAWSPTTRALREETHLTWSGAAIPTRRVRSGSVSIEALPLRRSPATTPNSSPVLARAAVSGDAAMARKPSMKDVLDAKKRNDHFRFLFQLPSDEALLHKFEASLSFRKVFVLGRIYISAHYACFHSLLPEDKAELRLANANANHVSSGLSGSGSTPLTGAADTGSGAGGSGGGGGGSRVRGLRDGGVLADSVMRGRRASSSFMSGVAASSGASALSGGSGSLASAPFLKLVVPFSEIAQIGLEDDGPGSFLIALNTKRNQFVFSVVNADVFTRIQELKNEACARLVPPPRAAINDTRHTHARAATSPSRGEDIAPIDWSNPQQLKEFFGEFRSDEILNEEAKEHRWTSYFRENGMGVDMLKTLELKKLVYEGVPNGLRARMWQICSGSIYRMRSHGSSGLYQSLFEKFKGRQSLATEQIEKDLHRSFDHPFYQPGGLRINALRRVLTAYSWHNPEIGYCQSMNMIAAAFLLYLNEEEAFCLLITLVEDVLKGYYTKEMLGSCVDQRVFEVMLTEHMPRVHAHVTDTLGMPIAWFSCPWFLCLFIGKLPLKCVCRILDCFFLDGPCVLFQIGLALFKISENEVLNTKGDEGSSILAAMQQRTLDDTELLFKVALKDFSSITMDKVKQLRNSYKLQVIIDLEDEKRREAEWEDQQKMKETLERMAKENEKFAQPTAAATAATSPTTGRQRSNTSISSSPPSFIAVMAGAWSPTAASISAAAAAMSAIAPSTVPVPKRSSLVQASGGGSTTGNMRRRSSAVMRTSDDGALPPSPRRPFPFGPATTHSSTAPPTPPPLPQPMVIEPLPSSSSSTTPTLPATFSSSLPSPASPLGLADAMSDSSLQVDSSPAVLTRRRSNTSVDMNGPPSLEFLESLGADPAAMASPFASFSPPPESPYRAPLTLTQTTPGAGADGQRQRTLLGRRGTPSSPLAFSLSAAVGSSPASAGSTATATAAAAASSPTGSSDRSPSAASNGRRGTKLRLADMRSMKERGQFNEFSSWGINVLENLLGSSSPPPSPPSVPHSAATRALAASASSPSPLAAAAPSTPTTPAIDAETFMGGGGGGVDLKSKLASASSFISSLVAPSSP